MILAELKAAARTLREGWLVSWEVEGYVISNTLAHVQLEAGKGNSKRIRYFVTLDAAARVMSEDLSITSYTVRGREAEQPRIFTRRVSDK